MQIINSSAKASNDSSGVQTTECIVCSSAMRKGFGCWPGDVKIIESPYHKKRESRC